MLKKTIEFESYVDGSLIKEDFYFNLSKVEIAELELSEQGGLAEWLRAIVASGDNQTILAKFKDIVRASYGVRSADGRRFIKTPEVWAEFEQTGAYEALMYELMTSATASAEFVVAVVPKDLAEKAELSKTVSVQAKVLEKKTVDEYSDDELLKMPQNQFDKLVGRDPKKWSQRVLMIAFRRKTDS
jgi:hypothetical protein